MLTANVNGISSLQQVVFSTIFGPLINLVIGTYFGVGVGVGVLVAVGVIVGVTVAVGVTVGVGLTKQSLQ